jgi:hypothetical protein
MCANCICYSAPELDSTVQYLGIEVDDALDMTEQIKMQ